MQEVSRSQMEMKREKKTNLTDRETKQLMLTNSIFMQMAAMCPDGWWGIVPKHTLAHIITVEETTDRSEWEWNAELNLQATGSSAYSWNVNSPFLPTNAACSAKFSSIFWLYFWIFSICRFFNFQIFVSYILTNIWVYIIWKFDWAGCNFIVLEIGVGINAGYPMWIYSMFQSSAVNRTEWLAKL